MYIEVLVQLIFRSLNSSSFSFFLFTNTTIKSLCIYVYDHFFQNLMAHKMIPPCGMSWVMMSQYVLRKLKLLKKCGISRNPHLPTLK